MSVSHKIKETYTCIYSVAQQKGSIAQYVALAQQKGSMRDTALVSGVLFFVVSLSAVYLHYVTDFFFTNRTVIQCVQ